MPDVQDNSNSLDERDYFRGCTGLSEHAFQLLTAEVYAEWVCDKCLNSKNIPLVKFKP